MADRLRMNSYGKINLMLNIASTRDDGYHNLETVMQTVSLHDTIDIKLRRESGITIKCNLPYIPTDSHNIAWKAAESFIQVAGVNRGVEISIDKMIPVGGGMGGGSANAATILLMLDKLFGTKLSDEKLEKMALALGADVPFCLKRGTYFATGIGEELTKLPDMPKCHIVICKPHASVSSRNAYSVYDDFEAKEFYDYTKMLSAIEHGSIAEVASALGNSFEAPIIAEEPEIGEIKRKLLEMGALGAAMTGSGSVVFGLFTDLGRAHLAKNHFRLQHYRAFCVRPVAE